MFATMVILLIGLAVTIGFYQHYNTEGIVLLETQQQITAVILIPASIFAYVLAWNGLNG